MDLFIIKAHKLYSGQNWKMPTFTNSVGQQMRISAN